MPWLFWFRSRMAFVVAFVSRVYDFWHQIDKRKRSPSRVTSSVAMTQPLSMDKIDLGCF